jgi:tetratricopeptide (TPR) repeat protein
MLGAQLGCGALTGGQLEDNLGLEPGGEILSCAWHCLLLQGPVSLSYSSHGRGAAKTNAKGNHALREGVLENIMRPFGRLATLVLVLIGPSFLFILLISYSRSKADDAKSSAGNQLKEVYKKAIQEYEDAVECETCGDYAEASRIYQQILKTVPKYQQARYRLGWCYSAQGNKKGAIEEWTIVVNKGKNNTESFVQEVCEDIEKASLPEFTSEMRHQFESAMALLEAAKSLRNRWELIAESSLVALNHRNKDKEEERGADYDTRNYSLNRRISDLAKDAEGGFSELANQHPDLADYLGAPTGEANQIRLEISKGDSQTAFGSNDAEILRMAALKQYENYLAYYEKLGIPDTAKSREIRRRKSEVRNIWHRTD